MPSADRHAPLTAPIERTSPVYDATVDPATADHVRQLLDEARLVESAFETTRPAPAAPATPAVPVPPPGYTLKTIHHTTPDGGSRVEYEVVPLALLAPSAAPSGPGKVTGGPGGRPAWLTTNTAKLKAATYLAGGGALTTGLALYGPAIGAGISAGAAALWGFVVTALKVVGVFLGGLLVLRVLCSGGKDKKPRTGTFEGTLSGTWKQD
ncbi:hypothetical protein ACFC5T_40335 [Streptomyces sp. NPDC055961]|uniref:hypothetical protein n=1 Tax=Streptomyces sp. NPDC055961 TaxID=3345666 RepID=UPI0035DFF1A1